MATRDGNQNLAAEARRLYTEQLAQGLPAVAQALGAAARSLLDKPAEYALLRKRRDMAETLLREADHWQWAVVDGLRSALLHGVTTTRASKMPHLPTVTGVASLSLVDNSTIEREILGSRLALAIMDRASWEFSDLRSRVAALEGRAELEPNDMLRAHVLAQIVLDVWCATGFSIDAWRELQATLHEEFTGLVEEAYHEANRWLLSRGVMPEVDLRPFIRRSRSSEGPTAGAATGVHGGESASTHTDAAGAAGAGRRSTDAAAGGFAGSGGAGGGGGPAGASAGGDRGGRGTAYRTTDYVGGHTQVADETRLMTRTAAVSTGSDSAEVVLGRLNRLVASQLPSFATTQLKSVSPRLQQAIGDVQVGLRQRTTEAEARTQVSGETIVVTAPELLVELQQRKQQLKAAAATPEERATIEIVALLFQSILMEERIPAALRVWFARLQMPVLRVAVAEPDFFATINHPARRLIDRMGACVMGFDTGAPSIGDALDKEIKRVVQVVEAYPDTGRRVFQAVLTEFEKFLENYLRNRNDATRKAVSLAQQIEQRETLAVQYTIELRKMLNEVPVQEVVRQFLFHVWADVLAMTAVRFGPTSDQTKAMKRAAADLIWSASAKVTREERAEVIRRLPPLLKALRDGMAETGIDGAKQDEHIQQLNNSLAAAFTARAAVIPHERLSELMEQLETLEELLPDTEEVTVDEAILHEIAGQDGGELTVVSDGGSMPTPAMVAWARELQVGTWYMLELAGKSEPVQLAWHGARKQLLLFVTPHGHCVLFQQQRLAAYLQAGLMLPSQDEALTVRATRTALAKLDAEPRRLLE
jgi:hypothetical protein